jgi:hypothetical protein
MPEDATLSREAKHGEKMIEVKIRFWTDSIAPEGHIIPKHALTSGVVRMEANKSHGISPKKPLVFHSLLDVGAVIEKVLLENGVVLHPSQKMKKYIKTST